MNKGYIVGYSYEGNHGACIDVNIFITLNKNIATKYVEKFNSILKKLQTYYNQFDDVKFRQKFKNEKHIEIGIYKGDRLYELDGAWIKEIELKN